MSGRPAKPVGAAGCNSWLPRLKWAGYRNPTSAAKREEGERRAAEDQVAVFGAPGGELLQRQAQRVAVALAPADRREIAAPQHPPRAEGRVGLLQQWRDRPLEWERLGDRQCPPAEFAQPGHLDEDIRVARERKRASSRLASRLVLIRAAHPG